MIVAVTGGKGGVGKSTVAYNLAAALDAVVVDADLGMADLPTARGPDLHDVLAGRATALEAVREGGPVPILPCGRSLAGARAVEPTELVAAIDAVAAAYDRVIVDCPAGLGGGVGLALHAADAAVLVTTPRPAALSDAVRARALARELDVGLAGVVLNRATGAAPTDEIARELGAPVTVVPESDAVATAGDDGVPVARVAPGSTPAARFDDLATRVASAFSRSDRSR